jgi:hypothetical protein
MCTRRKASLPGKGRVNPYTDRRFRLTPQMIAEARRWREKGGQLEQLPRRFYDRGWLELGQVWYCWLALSRIDSASMAEIADAVEAFDRLAGKGGRQGWRVSAEERRALELYAVSAATSYFVSEGYDVKNVGGSKSWDLECTKGQKKLRVEVKGTTGNGSEVLLTVNEVDHAKNARVELALYVLAGIKLGKGRGGKPVCRGGRGTAYWPWRINADGMLSAVGWSYSLG